jgi:hypothetical protein
MIRRKSDQIWVISTALFVLGLIFASWLQAK